MFSVSVDLPNRPVMSYYPVCFSSTQVVMVVLAVTLESDTFGLFFDMVFVFICRHAFADGLFLRAQRWV